MGSPDRMAFDALDVLWCAAHRTPPRCTTHGAPMTVRTIRPRHFDRPSLVGTACRRIPSATWLQPATILRRRPAPAGRVNTCHIASTSPIRHSEWLWWAAILESDGSGCQDVSPGEPPVGLPICCRKPLGSRRAAYSPFYGGWTWPSGGSTGRPYAHLPKKPRAYSEW